MKEDRLLKNARKENPFLMMRKFIVASAMSLFQKIQFKDVLILKDRCL